ncbi:hypothetical protein ACQP2X_21660 [Actinoplanes sp. CA-131856]
MPASPRSCLLVAALTAAFLALVNLLSHSSGGVTTDGAHLQHDRPAEARRDLLGIFPSVGADGAYGPLVRAIAEAGVPGADDPVPVVTDILGARRAGPSRSTNGTNGITTDVRQ